MIEVRAAARPPLDVATARVLRMLTVHELDGEAAAAVADAEPVLMRAGVAGVTKQIAVQTLSPSHYPNRVVIPIRWLATGHSGEMFPTLDANLELRRQGSDRTELMLIGSYRPPFGRAGAAIDQLLLHRVAERTLSRFLGWIATTLDSAAAVDPVSEPDPAHEAGPEPQT
jgi:hypothetical protein